MIGAAPAAAGGTQALCSPNEFRPTWKHFCTTPGPKSRPFRPTLARQPESHKQLARAAWGETRRISAHEKKKKILVWQNSALIGAQK
jgi:hypothetical protein